MAFSPCVKYISFVNSAFPLFHAGFSEFYIALLVNSVRFFLNKMSLIFCSSFFKCDTFCLQLSANKNVVRTQPGAYVQNELFVIANLPRNENLILCLE